MAWPFPRAWAWGVGAGGPRSWADAVWWGSPSLAGSVAPCSAASNCGSSPCSPPRKRGGCARRRRRGRCGDLTPPACGACGAAGRDGGTGASWSNTGTWEGRERLSWTDTALRSFLEVRKGIGAHLQTIIKASPLVPKSSWWLKRGGWSSSRMRGRAIRLLHCWLLRITRSLSRPRNASGLTRPLWAGSCFEPRQYLLGLPGSLGWTRAAGISARAGRVASGFQCGDQAAGRVADHKWRRVCAPYWLRGGDFWNWDHGGRAMRPASGVRSGRTARAQGG